MSNITVPYSVNAIDGHSSSYSKGNYTFTTTINLPKAQPTYLWFQHADQSADIYVDNVKVTTHWGGYNAFFTDISEYVHAGENEIKVILCNTTRNTLAPYSADFNFNATLGKVKVITSPVMPDMFYGYDGFHITATNVSSAAATLIIKTSVPVGATVVCKIDDDDSNYHFYDEKPSTGEEMSFITTITNPILWNGKINPHLYDVTLEIYKNGDLYHRFQRGYGIRYYSYVYNYTLPNNETYTGFLLNGSPYLLRGVCMHDDLEGKANALDDDDYTQEFAMINEVGCNFIRLAHYPHPKEVYDWCDRLGIIVQTEVPLVNNIKSTQPEDYYTHLEGQYYDMVTQHYNHPCIMFWGLGNEFNAQMDSDGGAFACTKLEHFRDIIKTYDTERMVGCVLNANSSNPRSTVGGADMDWYGCNIYVGWYSNTNSNNPTSQLNTRLNNVKDRPIAYSEYGCGGTQHCHSENYMSTTTRGNHERHDIEYQMWLHEGHIAAIKNFPQLIFTSEWQFFDIAVSNRNEGYTVCPDGENSYIDDNLRRLNNKGLVERDHRTKKDTFYLYKAWWNQTDKFVHICGKDYEKYENRVIKCYTNDGSTLKLYVDNNLVETVNVTNNIATFTARNYAPGVVIRVDGTSTSDSISVHDYSLDYLTFNVLTSGTIVWKNYGTDYIKTIYYSKNGGTWTSMTSSREGTSISVNLGDVVRFKGNNDYYGHSGPSADYSNYFNGTANVSICGNIMSLIGGDNFSNLNTLNNTYIFYALFQNYSSLIDVKNLVLPATTLTSHCYQYMFSGCTSLTTAPELPATTLATYCYYGMFNSCTSLTTTPELPVTTLTNYCYYNMFNGCTSLTTAPVLPATTLVTNCYFYMFSGCTSLTTAPALPATTLASGCYCGMFNGCTSLTTAPALPAATLTYRCYQEMFKGCTSLTTAPELPATTLDSQCYYSMFSGCTSLTTAPELPATTLETSCYHYMFNGCTSLTTAPALPAITLTYQCYQGMFNGCTSLNYIKCLATDISASNCTNNWVNGVATTGTFVKDPNMSSWTTGVSGIPTGWVVEDYNPYTDEYLTFDVKSDGSITWKKGSYATAKTISYSKNDGEWTNITSTTSGVSIPVVTGDKVRFKGNNSSYSASNVYTYNNLFGGTATFDAYGNIMSLIGGDNFSNLTTLSSSYTFTGLFYNCAGLLSAENIILPATTLADGCYSSMFRNTSLTTAPELPATALTDSCYANMFQDCTSLTTAPSILPATTLVDHCYMGMFWGCTGLTSAPTLPATTLASYCYSSMFRDCASLTTAPTLPATTLAIYCYRYMFNGCTSLTTAPVLPATTLVERCYYQMFYGCSLLNYIKCLATDISASNCTNDWVNGVAATGTFVKDPNMSSWTTGTSGIPTGWTVEDYHDYSNDYLTFDIKSSGDIVWKKSGGSNTSTISYSKNDGTWTDITSDTTGVSISVTTGDKVKFKGSNSVYYIPGNYYNCFGGTATFDAYGNIMSLIGGDNFSNLTTLSSDHNFYGLFKNCTRLISAENLIFPVTTLVDWCYYEMFYGCTNLTTAPALPATTLATGCYSSMFKNCTSLTTAPVLPATTLLTDCYQGMFNNCTSLTTAPELPATTLATGCYWFMFYGCTSLTTAPALPATTLVEDCYGNMFNGCTGLTTTPELPATTLATGCYSSMFKGCTGLTTAPALPATTLASKCYSGMFNGCTGLTTTPVLPATTLEDNCYAGMFRECTSLATAPVLPATTLVSACYYQMFRDCTHLNYIKCLATNISAESCLTNWVRSVNSTGTFVKNPNMSSWTTGNNGIPTGWTVADDGA